MISIVVPVYKVRDYLPGCLDSILANDTSDCEIILVDDGSPDDCGAICDRYAEANPGLIRVIHQANGGIGSVRNTGVANAKGEWLFFIDSDDTIAPDSLRVLKNAIAKGGADVIGFQFCADDGTNPPIPKSCGFDAQAEPFRLSDRKDYLLSLPSVWIRLWKRSLFTKSGIHFPTGVWYEDIRTTAKLLPLADGIRVLPDHIYNYLTRQGSIMNNQNLKRNRDSGSNGRYFRLVSPGRLIGCLPRRALCDDGGKRPACGLRARGPRGPEISASAGIRGLYGEGLPGLETESLPQASHPGQAPGAHPGGAPAFLVAEKALCHERISHEVQYHRSRL